MFVRATPGRSADAAPADKKPEEKPAEEAKKDAPAEKKDDKCAPPEFWPYRPLILPLCCQLQADAAVSSSLHPCECGHTDYIVVDSPAAPPVLLQAR